MFYKKSKILAFLLLCCLFAFAQDAQEIAKNALNSTVSVTFFNYAYSDKILGSGFVIEDNIIATNYHVVSLGNEGYIQKSQTDTTKHAIKRLVAVDPDNDLALFEVENLGMPALSITTEELKIGEKIYAAGNPLGLSGTFSDGIVSANRKIDGQQVIQITAPVSSGSSGGPVLNSKGKLVGVVFSSNKAGQNLNFVVPAEKLLALKNKKRVDIALMEMRPLPAKEDQMTLLLTEQFNDYESSRIKGLKVKQGQYTILESSDKTSYAYNTVSKLRYKSDYVIEARTKTLPDQQSCLYWGSLSGRSTNFTNGTVYNTEIIHVFCQKNGTASLGKYTNGEYGKIEDDTKLTVFNKGDFNEFKITKRIDSLYYSINGHILFKTLYQVFPGNEVGLGSEEKGTKVTIDYYKVKQANNKINLSPKIDTLVKASKLPQNINSKYYDLFPIVSTDGTTLYFTRYYSPENKGKEKSSDIYTASLTGTTPIICSNNHKFNNDQDNYCFGVSNGGNLYIESIADKNLTLRRNAYLSVYSTAQEESKEIPNFKSFYCYQDYSVYTISNDENTIIVSLKRADTFGSSDLYVSHRDPKGNWSELINLGPVLNTEYNEGAAFISADNNYLIFNSEGHPGYGEGDLFISERLDSTWLNWSKPLNLGPGINTKGDENNPFISLKSNELYFNRSEKNQKDTDIFNVKLNSSLKNNVTLGHISLEKNGWEVEIIELPENRSQKISLGQRSSFYYAFKNSKKYLVKCWEGKTLVLEKELDFSSSTEYKELEVKL